MIWIILKLVIFVFCCISTAIGSDTPRLLDVVFLVDSSASLSPHSFGLMRSSLLRICFSIGANRETRIGILQYGDNNFYNPDFNSSDPKYYRYVVKLGECANIECVRSKIDSKLIQMNSPNTYTALAMERAVKVDFAASDSSSQKILIVFTDGNANDQDNFNESFSLAQRSNVSVFALGFGDEVNTENLQLITSETNHVFVANSSSSACSLLYAIYHVINATVTCVNDTTVDTGAIIESALNVTLNGTFNSKAGSRLIFTCQYDDVTPLGNTTRFQVGNQATILQKNKAFTLQANRDHNLEPIFCQAVTNYTKYHPEAGKSKAHVLNITYPPTRLTDDVPRCDWTNGKPGDCKIYLLANPKPTEINIKKAGIRSTSLVTSIEGAGENFNWSARIRSEMVTPVDGGNYSVEVESSTFPAKPLQIKLHIHVVTLVHENHTNVTWIVVLISMIFLAAVVALVALLWWRRRLKVRRSEIIQGRHYVSNNEVYDDVINVQYTPIIPQQTSGQSASVDVRRAPTDQEFEDAGYLVLNIRTTLQHQAEIGRAAVSEEEMCQVTSFHQHDGPYSFAD